MLAAEQAQAFVIRALPPTPSLRVGSAAAARRVTLLLVEVFREPPRLVAEEPAEAQLLAWVRTVLPVVLVSWCCAMS